MTSGWVSGMSPRRRGSLSSDTKNKFNHRQVSGGTRPRVARSAGRRPHQTPNYSFCLAPSSSGGRAKTTPDRILGARHRLAPPRRSQGASLRHSTDRRFAVASSTGEEIFRNRGVFLTRWSQQGGGGQVISRQRRSTFTHPQITLRKTIFVFLHVMFSLRFYSFMVGEDLGEVQLIDEAVLPPTTTLHPPSCTQRRHLYITITFFALFEFFVHYLLLFL